MGDMIKQTDEIMVGSEDEAKALIESFKENSFKEGYEVASYSSTHKVTKNDEYYLVKIVKKWQ